MADVENMATPLHRPVDVILKFPLVSDGTLSKFRVGVSNDPSQGGAQLIANRTKRLLEFVEEGPKKAKIAYTAKDLVQWVKDVGAHAAHPDVLVDLWAQAGGDHMDFMAQYVKYCEVLFLECLVSCRV